MKKPDPAVVELFFPWKLKGLRYMALHFAARLLRELGRTADSSLDDETLGPQAWAKELVRLVHSNESDIDSTDRSSARELIQTITKVPDPDDEFYGS
jgi:hypothetical protein